MSQEIVQADVLVVGCGLAGLIAAVEAHDLGAKVVLLNKGVMGQDGAATWMAGKGNEIIIRPPDTFDTFLKDTFVGGRFLNNQEHVRVYLEEAIKRFEYLERWGLKYHKINGKLDLFIMPGHEYARNPRPAGFVESTGGGGYRMALPRQARIRKIPIFEDTMAVDLLTYNGEAVGVVGLDIREGKARIFKAKSVIMANGGFTGCYDFVTANKTLTGDGDAAGYRAGAVLQDMEFTHFFPIATIWPPSLRESPGPGWGLFIGLPGACRLFNRFGERFMLRYYPEEGEWVTRERIGRAVYREVKEGRGSPHAGCYLSVRHLPRNLVQNLISKRPSSQVRLDFLAEGGIDLFRDGVEVFPGAHSSIGGIWVDARCQSTLPGLYAIGEAGSGGKDGAERLAGNAITYCIGMGFISARESAARAKEIPMPEIDREQAATLIKALEGPVRKRKGPRPFEIRQKIRTIMHHNAMYMRTDEGLKEGLSQIEFIRQNDIPGLCVSNKNPRFNLEWVAALEARNMALVAEAVFRAALARQESRGGHEREDYPRESPEWFQRNLVVENRGKMVLKTEPVEFPYFKPDAPRSTLAAETARTSAANSV